MKSCIKLIEAVNNKDIPNIRAFFLVTQHLKIKVTQHWRNTFINLQSLTDNSKLNEIIVVHTKTAKTNWKTELPEIIRNQTKLQQTRHFKQEKKYCLEFLLSETEISFPTKFKSKHLNSNAYRYQWSWWLVAW